MKPWIRLTGLATLLSAVLVVGVLVATHLDTNSSAAPTSRDIPSFTSEQAVAVVKEWIAGGTDLEAVKRVAASLVCAGYYEGGGRWDVRCRLPWIPAEEYFFLVSEASGEVKPQTEATLTFVQMLRQWGQVPEP
jgi:hypothetical protein